MTSNDVKDRLCAKTEQYCTQDGALRNTIKQRLQITLKPKDENVCTCVIYVLRNHLNNARPVLCIVKIMF